MDFYRISRKVQKDGTVLLYPDWQVDNCTDLMIQSKAFFAFWDEHLGLWSRDEFRLRQLIDIDLHKYAKEEMEEGIPYSLLTAQSFSSGVWKSFNEFVRNFPDNHQPLDTNLTFASTKVKKSDYVSKRLPYDIEEGNAEAWHELMSVLYSDEERAKLEWAIGAILCGDSKRIQKFLVLYGPPASGKSTVIGIIERMFAGYCTSFDAKALGTSGNNFATDVFKSNPLVAIQHDGDLSRIEDNARLNSITSHEVMVMNEKFKASYSARVNAFLFMGTNKPVQITDAKAGTIRRLIDVHPTGARVAAERYHILLEQINFQLGAIAYHCLNVYKTMGRHYYNGYRPVAMMFQTDEFYNFINAHYDVFKTNDGVSLKNAWTMYREWCAEVNITRLMKYAAFREELRSYFRVFHERKRIGEDVVRSYYEGFEGVPSSLPFVPDTSYSIELKAPAEWYGSENNHTIFDRLYDDMPAQYANDGGTPEHGWDFVKTTLADIDPTKLHYVKVPENHIVIDFDLKGDDGNKDVEKSLEAAAAWPPTYTELSQSGNGVHLHYIYNGDVNELKAQYDEGIEVKTLLGGSSLRRKLSLCNGLDISPLQGGLPKKEAKTMLSNQSIQSEKGLRKLIERNLAKEIHPGTKPSILFIKDILDDVHAQGLAYDVSDMKSRIISFAAKSTNHSAYCIGLVKEMKFVSEEPMELVDDINPEDPIVFYDVEVYPNLFMICWKYAGSDTVVRMINPKPEEVESLLNMRLVGFNNRRYDNHILYAACLGYNNLRLYDLSDRIVNKKDVGALFGEAYNLSYTDIYDFSSKKQGLKKFMIELGINHMELDIPWDQPVPEKLWPKVEEYCVNDVLGTEAVFNARAQDFAARQILAEISGLTVNHTTQKHTAQIIFGGDKDAQRKFVYTDLTETFPGYVYDGFQSTYRDEVVGEGGYVYAEPGIHENVALLDVASMHPTSIEVLDLFGPYTKRFSDLKSARMAIKHGDLERARGLLDGKLAEFVDAGEGDPAYLEGLSYALKIVINIVYGLTSAHFENPFRDPRNKDNIVAKRGALFMIDLKHAVQEKGFTVAHIKTDSIKIPGATPEIIDFVFEFGKKYGYDFEHEATYDKFFLANDAVYIAGTFTDDKHWKWTATGAQFQHPYVFKTLFSGEPLTFDDYCETKNVVQGTMYLDPNNAELVDDMVHVGRTGSFVPVKTGGGNLWRIKDDKRYAVTGTKNHRWVHRTVAEARSDAGELEIDMDYFQNLAAAAKASIEEYGDFAEFVAF